MSILFVRFWNILNTIIQVSANVQSNREKKLRGHVYFSKFVGGGSGCISLRRGKLMELSNCVSKKLSLPELKYAAQGVFVFG